MKLEKKVPCPKCGATVGEYCRTSTGYWTASMHASRTKAAIEAESAKSAEAFAKLAESEVTL